MTTRDEQRKWLADAKSWEAERDAVGVERLVDAFEVIDAAVAMGRVDLRRWTRFSPEVTVKLRAARAALDQANRLMMETIQDRVGEADQ